MVFNYCLYFLYSNITRNNGHIQFSKIINGFGQPILQNYIYLKHKRDSHSFILSFLQRKQESAPIMFYPLCYIRIQICIKTTTGNNIYISDYMIQYSFWHTFIQKYLLSMHYILCVVLRITITLMSQNEHGSCFHVTDHQVAYT